MDELPADRYLALIVGLSFFVGLWLGVGVMFAIA